jgi:hypothetical protein
MPDVSTGIFRVIYNVSKVSIRSAVRSIVEFVREKIKTFDKSSVGKMNSSTGVLQNWYGKRLFNSTGIL